MVWAVFRFHGNLGDFLARGHRGRVVPHACARAATLKNAIEALGVPHTEVGRVEVNGQAAPLARPVREGDRVEVHPQGREALAERPRFLADAHLGGLARFLRMLGYDTLHENDLADADIRRIVAAERRILLTRDRELLKCREIERGCYVHEKRAEAQLREVAGRYGLDEGARPFTLCLACNLPLGPAAAAEARAYAPPAVLERHAGFLRCAACRRIYWPGTHYERMRQALARILPDRRVPGLEFREFRPPNEEIRMAAKKAKAAKKRAAPARFRLTSPDFRPNGPIGMEQVFNSFGCTGKNISPALAWSGAPAGTQSFALLCHDPDAPTGGAGWWHWLVLNIPASATGLAKDAGKADGSNLPAGAAHVNTDFGGPGWGGPCPPVGHGPHRYVFTLYALKVDKLDASGGTASLAGYMVNGNAIAKATLTGKFERKK